MPPLPRTLVGELMDDPAIDPGLHRQALRGLARLNSASRAAHAMWNPIAAYVRSRPRDAASGPLRMLDLATGSGDVAIGLCRLASRQGLDLRLTVSDISREACAAAAARAARHGMEAEAITADLLAGDPHPPHDVVINSLFLHHLSRDDAVRALAAMRDACRGVLVVSDLVRTRPGLLLAGVIPRLLTRSPVVHTDAVRSVRAAWTPEEMRGLCAEAGLGRAEISRIWPERQLVVWHADGER